MPVAEAGILLQCFTTDNREILKWRI